MPGVGESIRVINSDCRLCRFQQESAIARDDIRYRPGRTAPHENLPFGNALRIDLTGCATEFGLFSHCRRTGGRILTVFQGEVHLRVFLVLRVGRFGRVVE